MIKSMWTPACRKSQSRSWALIWSWSPLAAKPACTLMLRLSTRCWSIAAGTCFYSATSVLMSLGTDVGRLGLAHSRRSNSSQLCLMGLRSGLCRPVKFLHTDLDKPFMYGPRFVQRGVVMLEEERAFPNQLPQIWKHRIL